MKGFFSKKEVKKPTGSGVSKTHCEICGLWKGCVTPKMKVTGKGRLKVLLIGEAPGREEDEGNQYFDPGTQFIGSSGSLFREKLEPHDLDLERDFWKINAVNCRPVKNKKPTRKQIKCCKEYYVDNLIKKLRPEFIWLVGASAIESFYLGRFSRLSISRWRGLCIPDKKTKAWIVPMYHPSFLLRSKKKTKRGYVYYDKNIEGLIDRDLDKAVEWLDLEPPKFINFKKKVKIVTDMITLQKCFNDLFSRADKIKVISTFDYETSAVKPFNPMRKIWCMSISTPRETFSFPIDYTHWDNDDYEIVISYVVEYLEHPNIKKVAQNLKFEDIWSRVTFKMRRVVSWLWCTMNASHIIDDRKDYTGLKFQAYIHFGIVGYDKRVKPYMKEVPGTGRNRLGEFPLEELLMYCGLDSAITRSLFFLQRGIIKRSEDLSRAYDLTHRGLLAFSDTQLRGFPVDELYYIEEDISLGEKIEKLEGKLMDSKWAKKFKKKYKRDINLGSSHDQIKLFKNVMGVKLTEKTEKGNTRMTAEVLESLNVVFAKKLVEWKKLKKTKGTYMHQITKEIVDGHIHAFIDLHIPRSYRSSSSDPNLQNVPTREEEAKKSTRSGFKPELGCRLGFGDYGSQEVRIIACYTKDENLIAYVEDETTDMHRDQAEEIFVLTDETITKDLRFYTKNQFVFPEFYGSYYVTCARNLWHLCSEFKTGEDIPVWRHLIEEGVIQSKSDFKGFENHVKGVEKNFWEKFPEVREWQQRSIAFYQQHGYIETMFGHQRRGLLTPNMIVNTPIQATAFHCLLWSYIKLNAYSKRYFRSRLIVQIHDELVWNIHPEEEIEVVDAMCEYMENKVRERYDFLIVPLKSEIEMTGIDQSWYKKEEW